MLKRFDGSNWIDTSIHRRFDGSNWVDCSSIKRWDGTNWVDCMMTRQYFVENISHLVAYNSYLNIIGKSECIYDIGYSLAKYCSVKEEGSGFPKNSINATIRFKAIMKNGKEYELSREFLTSINCDISIDIYFSYYRILGKAQFEVFGLLYEQKLQGNKYMKTGELRSSFGHYPEIKIYTLAHYRDDGIVNILNPTLYFISADTNEKICKFEYFSNVGSAQGVGGITWRT